MNIVERYGRKSLALEETVETLQATRQALVEAQAAEQRAEADATALLSLLRRLKSGEVPLDDVELLDDGWRVVPSSHAPAVDQNEGVSA